MSYIVKEFDKRFLVKYKCCAKPIENAFYSRMVTEFRIKSQDYSSFTIVVTEKFPRGIAFLT